MTEIISFFAEYKYFFVVLHLLGFAFGLGGAVIADKLFFRFLNDLKISDKEKEALSIVSMVIFVGLGILYLSGTALVLSDPERYLNSSKFLTKLFIVVVITLNGILLHKLITPKLIHIHWHKGHQAQYRNIRKLAFACGAVSVISWFTSFILGTVKTIPVNTIQGISIYLGVIVIAIIGSQFAEKVFSKVLDWK
jgi:hypothetical protein